MADKELWRPFFRSAFALKEPYARGREMIDAGCAVALATDLNPGSCFSGSIPDICLGVHLYENEYWRGHHRPDLEWCGCLNRADSIGRHRGG